MRLLPAAHMALLLLFAGCSDDSANPDKTSGDPTSPPKIMIDSREYESLTAFLGDQRAGFVILHQLRAPGEDLTDGEDPVTPVLAERFDHFLNELEPHLGKPDQQAGGWDLGIPTFASGNGYALWNGTENFISLFVSWDNPEDPSFVIVARAPLSVFDSTPGASDPWQSKWMEKGEW